MGQNTSVLNLNGEITKYPKINLQSFHYVFRFRVSCTVSSRFYCFISGFFPMKPRFHFFSRILPISLDYLFTFTTFFYQKQKQNLQKKKFIFSTLCHPADHCHALGTAHRTLNHTLHRARLNPALLPPAASFQLDRLALRDLI
jgi:hypothetical protein